MTTMTTQDEQAEQDDVQGYVEPLTIITVAFAIGTAAFSSIALTGPELQGTLKGLSPGLKPKSPTAPPPR